MCVRWTMRRLPKCSTSPPGACGRGSREVAACSPSASGTQDPPPNVRPRAMSDLTDDELASAYLDGEVTADERARVESDRALLARVDLLRSARDALMAAPLEPTDAAAKDAAIRAAV